MAQPTGLGNTNFYYVTAQGRYYLVPTPNVQPAAQPPQLPVLPSIDAPRVDAIGRLSLQPRPALAPVQNLPTLEPQALAASPHIPVGLEKFLIEKIAETRRLASLRTQQVENTGLSTTILIQPIGLPVDHSNLFYTRLPTNVPAPMLRGELPPIPALPQQGIVPAAAAVPKQQAQPPARETSAGLKRPAPEPARGHLDFRHRTPDSFRVPYDARKPKTQPGLPEPQPVSTPVAPPPRERKTKEKPAAAHLDFTATLTPQNYQAEREKAKARYIDSYYETSEESKEALEWISKAVQYLEAKEYTDAVTALHLAFEKLPHGGFVYKLLCELDAICIISDIRIGLSDPAEEDVDVLVLRGIRKIKYGKYDEAKADLQKVLTQKPNDSLALLIFDYACLLINRSTQQGPTNNESAEATNYDSVKLG